MRVYSLKDRITVKIDELEFKLAPLSYKQKIEIQSLLTSGKEVEGTILAVKYSVKHVSGLEDSDGNEYKLSFENDSLTEDSIDALMNIECGIKLQLACAHLLNGIPKEIIHPETGKAIEGVKVVNPSIKKKKKH